jgi:hypothetical protein
MIVVMQTQSIAGRRLVQSVPAADLLKARGRRRAEIDVRRTTVEGVAAMPGRKAPALKTVKIRSAEAAASATPSAGAKSFAALPNLAMLELPKP